MSFILNRFLYNQRAFYRARPGQSNDKISQLLNSKAEQFDANVMKDKLIKQARVHEEFLVFNLGTRDYHPNQMMIREEVFRTVTQIFKQHGAQTIDTPIIETTKLLREKYGEESKLIFELKDQEDDEQLSLRYDLTVPFARYLSQNQILTMKRYQIGKVYRRDQPKMARARYREFYQCDFDVAGSHDSVIPDAECIKIIAQILDQLQLGNYIININHRKLLDGIFTVCGVPNQLFRSLSSSIDKLDKVSLETVRSEMINEKGLSPDTVDNILSYIEKQGDSSLIDKLRNDSKLSSEKLVLDALDDLQLLFDYLKLLNLTNKVKLDLKLARGLDYYTGVTFEAVITEYKFDKKDDFHVGSVAAGGRYDQLIEKIHPKQKHVPCVGLSIGLERIFAIKENQLKELNKRIKTIDTEIYVASAEKHLLAERLKMCSHLWENGFKTEMAYRRNPKLLDQLQYCEKNQIELCVIIGSSELEANAVKIRHVNSRNEFVIQRNELLDQLRLHLSQIRQTRTA